MEKNNKNLNREIILSKKVGLVDKYNFFEYISVMLDGGVGITESLESVNSKISSTFFRQKISELITYINSGDSFSRAMRKIPSVFNSSEVFIVESGEATGQLSLALMKLSDDLKKIYDLRKKIKGSLTYPIIIFLFIFLAIAIVMTYVVPAIKPLFQDSGTELPIATQTLIASSDFVINNYPLIFLVIITVIFGIMFYFNGTNSGKFALEKMILGTPLIGKVYKNYILANIASTLGNLVGSGVSIVKSLDLTGKATNSVTYERLFEQIKEKVSLGNGIVKSMEEVDLEKNYFPSDYLQMLSVGERTANLEEISKKLNRQYEKEVDYSLANLTKWIEPIAILFAGIFVLWFVFGIFSAIIKVTDTIS
ncbi:hypothetical protein BKN14_03270 [Candidatus Gracilibacteria bacterium HOT-871]|nr:hypothetical protein BKN14_03270 [Candidatus Gracilibacteria bacterium HOT-871]MBB1564679.1 type II secretion system F family protein [Candidatus Gracilibacteria bacterium]